MMSKLYNVVIIREKNNHLSIKKNQNAIEMRNR